LNTTEKRYKFEILDMLKYVIYCLLFVSVAPYYAKAETANIALNKAIIKEYYSSIHDLPITKKQNIINQKINTSNLYAKAKWYFIKAFDQYYINGYNDSISIQQSIAIARKNNFVEILIEALHFKAARYFEAEHFEAAFTNFNEIQRLAVEYPSIQLVSSDATWHSIAVCYFKFEDYTRAKSILIANINLQKIEEPFFYFQIHNTLGMCYYQLNQLDSATYFFNRCYHQGVATKDSARISVALGNLGKIDLQQHKTKDAISKLMIDYRLSNKYADSNNAANAILQVAEIYLQQSNSNVADDALKLMTAWLLNKGSAIQLKKFYDLKSKILRSAHQLDQSFICTDSANKYAAIIDQKLDNRILMQAKIQSLEDVYQLEQKLADAKIKKDSLIRNFIVAIAILSLLAILLLVNRMRIKQKSKVEEEKSKNKQLALEKENAVFQTNEIAFQKKQLDLELEIATQKLEDFTKGIHERNELIASFEQELELLKTQIGSSSLTSIEQKKIELNKSQILTEEQWQDFKVLFESVHKGFFIKLSTQFPDLTQGEMRYLAISKLNITTKEMANMLGVSIDSVTKTKYRLNKKYQDAGVENPLLWLEKG
jgi:hypothetical protein